MQLNVDLDKQQGNLRTSLTRLLESLKEESHGMNQTSDFSIPISEMSLEQIMGLLSDFFD